MLSLNKSVAMTDGGSGKIRKKKKDEEEKQTTKSQTGTTASAGTGRTVKSPGITASGGSTAGSGSGSGQTGTKHGTSGIQSAAELAGSVRSSLVSPMERAETISQLTKKLQESAPSPTLFTTSRLGENQVAQGVAGDKTQALLDQYKRQVAAQQEAMSATGIQAQIDELDKRIEAAKSGGYTRDPVSMVAVYKNQDQIDQLTSQRGSLEAQLEQAKTIEWENQQREAILEAGGQRLLAQLREYDRFKKGKSETMTHEDFAAMLTDLAEKGYTNEQFMEMVDYAARLNSAEEYDAAIEKSMQFASEHPFWASLESVAGSLTSGFGMIDVADQNLRNLLSGKDTPVNYKTDLMEPSGATRAIRGQVASDIEKNTAGWAGSDTPLGNVYSNAYQLSMSMADSLGVVGLTAMGVPNAYVLLGGSAATSAMVEAKERGATDAQALTMGLISGVAESFFEKYSIESLFNLESPTTVKAALKNIVKQGIPEASEEFNTTIANTVADLLIMGDKSQLATAERNYMAQGMTASEASKQAGTAWFLGLMGDALGGFISGGLFAMGSNAMSGYQQSTNRFANNAQITGTGAAVNTDSTAAPLDQVVLDTLRQGQQTDGADTAADSPGRDAYMRLLQGNMRGAAEVQETAQAEAGAESTKVNTDPAVHTPQEQAVIEEYQGSVDQGLVQFAENVAKGNIPANKARYTLNQVTERAASDIQQITGVDTRGFSTVIEGRMVDHILKRHGKNGSADHSMQDLNDLGRIQYVIDNYDRISDSGTTRAYVTNKWNGKTGQAKTVVFEKAVNGTYYVVEAVPDTAAKTTYVVSAYMSKTGAEKAGARQTADTSTAPALTSENENVKAPADSNVAQTGQNVNGNQEQQQAGTNGAGGKSPGLPTVRELSSETLREWIKAAGVSESELPALRDMYIQNGMPPEEASQTVLQNMLHRYAGAFKNGADAVTAQAIAEAAARDRLERIVAGETVRFNGTAEALVEAALQLPRNTEARNLVDQASIARQAEILSKLDELEAAKKQAGEIQTSEQLLAFTKTIGRLEQELEALEQGRLSDRLDSEDLGRLAEAVENGQKLQLNQRSSDVQVSQNAGAELQELQLAAAWENGKLTEEEINDKVDKNKAVTGSINNDLYSVLGNGFADRENLTREAGRFKGKTTEDIQDFLDLCGYNTNFRKSKHSGSNAQIIQIFNNTSIHNIAQVQISPGGGRHGPNPYYKISTTDQGIIKIVFGDPKTYRTNGNEKAFIIFAEADLYD